MYVTLRQQRLKIFSISSRALDPIVFFCVQSVGLLYVYFEVFILVHRIDMLNRIDMLRLQETSHSWTIVGLRSDSLIPEMMDCSKDAEILLCLIVALIY